MRECDGRRENERKKKVSVRIEKGRKGGKNRVGTDRLEIRKSAIEVGIYCPEKAKSWNSEQTGTMYVHQIVLFLKLRCTFLKTYVCPPCD